MVYSSRMVSPKNTEKIIWIALVIMLLLLISIRIYDIYNFLIGGDEVETIRSGWLVYTGKLPYRDFFQHHTPLSYYINSIAFLVSSEVQGIITVSRWISFLFYLGSIFFMYKTGRLLFGRNGALLSVLFCGYGLELFKLNMVIVRDTAFLFFSTSALFFFFSASRNGWKAKSLFISGALVGLAVLCKQVAGFLIVAMFVVQILPQMFLIVKQSMRGNLTPLLQSIKKILPLLTGFVFVISLFFLIFSILIGFNTTLEGVYLSNYSLTPNSPYSGRLLTFGSFFFNTPLLWSVGIVVSLGCVVMVIKKAINYKDPRKVDRQNPAVEEGVESIYPYSGITIFYLMFLTLLSPYFAGRYYMLVFFPLSAVCVYAIKYTLLPQIKDDFWNKLIASSIIFLFVVLGIIAPIMGVFKDYTMEKTEVTGTYHREYVETMKMVSAIERITDPGDFVVSNGFGIRRKDPVRAWFNFYFAKGTREILENIRNNPPKVILSSLPDEIGDKQFKSFLLDNYIPTYPTFGPGNRKQRVLYIPAKAVPYTALLTPQSCTKEETSMVCLPNSTAYSLFNISVKGTYNTRLEAMYYKKGGNITISVDGKYLGQVDTSSDNIVPVSRASYIDAVYLSKGTHNLTIDFTDSASIYLLTRFEFAVPKPTD